jgi:exosortase F-associated protein
MENVKRQPADFPPFLRWTAGTVSVVGLLAVFLLQRDLSAYFVEQASPIASFMMNRAIRYVANDLFATLLVLALFGKKKYVMIAIYVQLLGLVLILMPYAVIKMYHPGYNGPLISFFHRLVLNPTLIYLLIFFFWYQEKHKVTRETEE